MNLTVEIRPGPKQYLAAHVLQNGKSGEDLLKKVRVKDPDQARREALAILQHKFNDDLIHIEWKEKKA